MKTNTLYYIHDPMCSWCFAFRQSLEQLLQLLPKEIEIQKLLGGLAADSSEPMPQDMQEQLQLTWKQIEKKVPDVHFNFDFWARCQPVRSTYPACRAVIAARFLCHDTANNDNNRGSLMTMAIQDGYYQRAQNPSIESTLADFAQQLGMDRNKFLIALHSEEVQKTLEEEIKLSRQLGARSFPSLILQIDDGFWPVSIDYIDPSPMLETISMLREFPSN